MKKVLISAACLMCAAGLASAADAGKQFKKCDTDGDGKLSKAEFTAMTRVQFEKNGKEGWEEAAVKRFAKKDTDKDGFLSLEEFSVQPEKKEKEKSEDSDAGRED